MPTVRLSSSLRTTPPEVTLALAKACAKDFGISRVTDITRLDRVGIPVYASIRPCAVYGSLCVSAGKGLRPIEAEVGAYMEAIELAQAEPNANRAPIVKATARDVLDGRKRPEAILDLCPRLGAKVRLDAPMDCVWAEEITTGERALVPAELVFLPYRPNARFKGLFGTTSNGLASGNSIREATVHGLCELMERDVCSFEAVRDTSVPVDLDSVEGPARGLVETIRSADLQLFVRAAKNVFGMPYFFAVINDPDSYAPHLLNGGFGFHPHRSVAFVRAVSEAAQSRLSFIHGGRDDLTNVHDRFHRWGAKKKRVFVEGVVARASRGTPTPMQAIDDHTETITTVERCESFVLKRLGELAFDRVYRIVLSKPGEPLHIVRTIVPKMEMYNAQITRVGARLSEHASAAS